MAVYKVIQDIEAEDKLLGPLTLKGLVYAGAAAILGFINFQLLTLGIPIFIKLPLVIVLAMPMALFLALASPLGRDQPTEVWLLARIKFLLKPRQRIWNQSGLSNLVTITAPKKTEKQLTKGFTQVEVESRLKALATTLDSRGWAVKNVNVNLNVHPDYLTQTEDSSDRLIGPSKLPQDQPVLDIHANDDILDEKNSPTAQNFELLMQKADEARKAVLAEKLERARAAAPVPEAPVKPAPKAQKAQPSAAPAGGELASFTGAAVIKPGQTVSLSAPANKTSTVTTKEEQALLDRLHKQEEAFAAAHLSDSTEKPHHGKILNPKPSTVTGSAQTGKLELAQSGSDLSVASIAHLANRGG